MEQDIELLRNEVYQMRNEIYEMRNEISQIKLNNDVLENKLANQHIELVQSINMQIGLLNSLNQLLNSMNNRLADVEIRTNYSDDSIKELVDSNNSVSQELHEIKNSIEAMKFYSLGFNTHQS